MRAISIFRARRTVTGASWCARAVPCSVGGMRFVTVSRLWSSAPRTLPATCDEMRSQEAWLL